MTQPRTIDAEPYEVCAYDTKTGHVALWLKLVSEPRWEDGLNISGSWSAAVALDDRYISRDELNGIVQKWDWSWAVCVGQTILQAGPVMVEDYDDSGPSTTINGVGLWTLYKDKRVLLNAGRASAGGIAGPDADLAFGPGATSDKGSPIPPGYRNLSWTTAIRRIFDNEQSKPGGLLPLNTQSVPELGGSVTVTYQGNELLSTGDEVYKITQQEDGPEVMLRPEFTTSQRQFVQHVLQVGAPRLGQLGYPHAWTYGQAVTRLTYTSDGSKMTFRNWDRGAGYDRNVIAGFAENMDGVTEGLMNRPLLETVGRSHTNFDQTRQGELTGYAQAEVGNYNVADLTLKLEVTLDGDAGDGSLPPSPPITRVLPGDTGRLYVRDHRRLPDGWYEVRVIKRTGGGGARRRVQLTVDVLKGGPA